MNKNCAYRLGSYEPIIEGLMRLEFSADGWELWVRHRHYAGKFRDCEVESYGRLTGEELADVLAATVAQWGPMGALPWS
jgi:hypothetical protein